MNMNSVNLKIMLELLNDESEELQNEIISQLYDYGLTLEEDIQINIGLLNESQTKKIFPILENKRREWIERNWNNVLEANDDFQKIECALNLISKFQYGLTNFTDLAEVLNKIQNDFLLKYPYADEMDLSSYLFQTLRISGDKENYYNPFNSNILFSIKEKKGNPITLCMLYVLLSQRCGFNVVGCNFPGHFLARVIKEDEFFLVDCFNGGRIIYDSEIAEMASETLESVQHIIKETPTAKTIIRRILSNLQHSYSIINQYENASLFQRLIKML